MEIYCTTIVIIVGVVISVDCVDCDNTYNSIRSKIHRNIFFYIDCVDCYNTHISARKNGSEMEDDFEEINLLIGRMLLDGCGLPQMVY